MSIQQRHCSRTIAAPQRCFTYFHGIPHRTRVSRRCYSRRQICQATSNTTETFRWPDWAKSWRYLTDCGLQSVDTMRAKDMVSSGKWIFVDVRPSSLYNKAQAEGAISIPLFDNMDWAKASPMAYVRSIAYLINGVSPVVPNEAFDELLSKAKAEGKGFIFYCETGGTMQPSTNFLYGKESRSLKACYRALLMDPSLPVAHLEGGLFAWYKASQPISGEYDPGNAGRTPNIAEEPDLKDTKQ